MSELILFRHLEVSDINDLDVYLANGGFEGLREIVGKKSPQEIIDIVKASGLRGRGGAGFPTGVKWSFLTKDVFPRYVVANADESEPGAFKDREIMERNPYQLLEGIAICCYAAQAQTAYIYCRGEFWDLAHELEAKIAELKTRGFLGKNLFGENFDLEIYVHVGAGAYICGEETALLESLEGKLGQPRLRPPFPAAEGLFAKPTVVNNVETLANIPPIITRGADWFRSIGTEKSTGTKIFSLSGHVAKPGNYELPMGTSFRELIYDHGNGIRNGNAIKAILPAGASAPLLPASEEILDTGMDYESVKEAGSELGSASIIVMDETVDISWVAYKTAKFFSHESCGKCTPCREGTYWMFNVMQHIQNGKGTSEDLAIINSVAASIGGKCLCALGDFSVMALMSGIEHFRKDFDTHLREKA